MRDASVPESGMDDADRTVFTSRTLVPFTSAATLSNDSIVSVSTPHFSNVYATRSTYDDIATSGSVADSFPKTVAISTRSMPKNTIDSDVHSLTQCRPTTSA